MAMVIKEPAVLRLTGDASDLKRIWAGVQKDADGSGKKISGTFDKAFKESKQHSESFFMSMLKFSAVSWGIRTVVTGLKAMPESFAEVELAAKRAAAVAGGGFAEMFAKARDIQVETGDAAVEAAQGMYQLASQGHDTARIMGEVGGMMKLATAIGAPLDTALRAGALQMNLFGISVERTMDVMDVLGTAVVKSTYSSLEELNTTLRYGSPLAAAFGYSLQQAAAMAMTYMSAVGDASTAGTAMRMTLAKLMDSTGASAKLMETYGVSVKDAKGNVKDFGEIVREFARKDVPLDVITDIFDVRAAPAFIATLTKMKGGVDTYADSIRTLAGATGNVERLHKEMLDTAAGRWKLMKGAFTEFGMSLWEGFAPLEKKIVTFMRRAAIAGGDVAKTVARESTAFMEAVGNQLLVTLKYLAAAVPAIVSGMVAQFDIFFYGLQDSILETRKQIALLLEVAAAAMPNDSWAQKKLQGAAQAVYGDDAIKAQIAAHSKKYDAQQAAAKSSADLEGAGKQHDVVGAAARTNEAGAVLWEAIKKAAARGWSYSDYKLGAHGAAGGMGTGVPLTGSSAMAAAEAQAAKGEAAAAGLTKQFGGEVRGAAHAMKDLTAAIKAETSARDAAIDKLKQEIMMTPAERHAKEKQARKEEIAQQRAEREFEQQQRKIQKQEQDRLAKEEDAYLYQQSTEKRKAGMTGGAQGSLEEGMAAQQARDAWTKRKYESLRDIAQGDSYTQDERNKARKRMEEMEPEYKAAEERRSNRYKDEREKRGLDTGTGDELQDTAAATLKKSSDNIEQIKATFDQLQTDMDAQLDVGKKTQDVLKVHEKRIRELASSISRIPKDTQ